MLRLLLIRHGRSTWNAEYRIQGQADPPLDETGREQADHLAQRLLADPPRILYASPLQRAQETAQIIARRIDVPVNLDPRLKELDVGLIEGLTWEQVLEQYPDFARRWEEAPHEAELPGAEDRSAFRSRVVNAFEEIIARHDDGTIGVVAHGGTLGTYLDHTLGLPPGFSPFRFANASLSIVEQQPDFPRVVLLNDRCHLQK
jgi:broad specificity phosphatase PhoE